MTISTLNNRVAYPGTGLPGPFAIPFRFLDEDHLRVTILDALELETELVLGVDYTTTGVRSASGTLTLTSPLVAGETLTIRRDPPLTQETSIRNQGTYFPSTIEDMLDEIVMQQQALKDRIDRAPKLAESYDPATYGMNDLVPVANRLIGFNAAGTAIETRNVSDSATVLPGGGRTVTSLSDYLAAETVFNVMHFGAVGGGPGTDDTLAFARARAAQVLLDGGVILIPSKTFRISSWDLSGAAPVVIVGDDLNRSVIQMLPGAVIAMHIGKTASNTGVRLENFSLRGDSGFTNLGGIKLGDTIVGLNTITAYVAMRNLRIHDFQKVGAWGIMLDRVQELDCYNVRVESNYDNIYRPNWGYVTSTTFRGRASYIGSAIRHGANLEGACADITFADGVIEGNGDYGITQWPIAGVGTLTATGAGPDFAGVFSTSQAGKVHNDGNVIVGGQLYRVQNFNGTTTCTLQPVNGGPNFGASAFSYGAPSRIVVDHEYFEANEVHIKLSGGDATYSSVRTEITHCQFAGSTSGIVLSIDRVDRSFVGFNFGFNFSGTPIVDTANSQVHYQDNTINTSALDTSGIYAALLGNNTYEDTNRVGLLGAVHRFIMGIRLIYSAFIFTNNVALEALTTGNVRKSLIKLNAANRVEIGHDNASTYFPGGTSGGAHFFGTTDTANVNPGDLRTIGGYWLKDGVAAPTTTTGFAALYVDNADGDLKVKFGDGVTKTIAVDT